MGEIISIYTREETIEESELILLEEYFLRSDFPEILLEVLGVLNCVGGRFELGELLITGNAAQTLKPADVLTALIRHQIGDWGELNAQELNDNEQALFYGDRCILSAYQDRKDVVFWIFTEWNREVTTVLLPGDH